MFIESISLRMDVPSLLNAPSPEVPVRSGAGSNLEEASSRSSPHVPVTTEAESNLEEGSNTSINYQSNPRLDLTSNISFAETLEKECLRIAQEKLSQSTATTSANVTLEEVEITRGSAERQKLLELFPKPLDNRPSFAKGIRGTDPHRTIV